MTPSAQGLNEAGDGCLAWVEPEPRFGFSNAGLVIGDGCSLLVDTLMDLPMTRAMLDGMAAVTRPAPIRTVVNTHANGDHYFGNQLVAGAEIVASTAAAEAMGQDELTRLDQMLTVPGPVGDLARAALAPFDFSGITVVPPTRTFDGHLGLDVGGTAVQLIEVGPAHTDGDVIAYVPDAKTVFTGDILFVDHAPVAWAGPLSNWVAACDRLLGLDVDTIVPGHGPITDKAGVEEMRGYLTHVQAHAAACHEAGLTLDDAIAEVDLGRFAAWPGRGLIAQNLAVAYRELDPDTELPNPLTSFERIARSGGIGGATGAVAS